MIKFEQTMRWYGPRDMVTLAFIKQSGCSGVVSALHQIHVGRVWSVKNILRRKKMINDAGLEWNVVESLPVHESIKMHDEEVDVKIDKYIQSMENLAECGIKVITYNFMPLFDWMRTDLDYEMEDGSGALFFDPLALAAFDLFMLKRPNGKDDYSEERYAEAKEYFESLSKREAQELAKTCLQGLPGSRVAFVKEDVLALLDKYKNISRDDLRNNLAYFLKRISPVAQRLGLKLAIHPDDPPFSIFGLPRIVTCKEDLQFILDTSEEEANGLCFCTGSLGVNSANDLIDIATSFKNRIHFVHLRNIRVFENGQFYESDHLDGSVDMIGVVRTLSKSMNELGKSLAVRPDHGHQFDMDSNINSFPGYSAIGRLRGLAEIRGAEAAIIAEKER